MDDEGEPEQEVHVEGVWCPGTIVLEEVECRCLRTPEVMRTRERKRTFGTGRRGLAAFSGSIELPVVSGSDGESRSCGEVWRFTWPPLLAMMMMGGGV